MKKIFASLGVILLVAILGVAVVFAYGSYKDLELKKEEIKVTENKKIVRIKLQTKMKFKNQQTQMKHLILMKCEQQKMVKKLKKLRMV